MPSAFYIESCELQILHVRSRDNHQVVHWFGYQGTDARLIFVEGSMAGERAGTYGHIRIAWKTWNKYNRLHTGATDCGGRLERPKSQPWPICDWFGTRDPDGNRV